MSDEKKTGMTREEIKATIKGGQHVSIHGRHITNPKDIPDGEEFPSAVVARAPDGRLTRAGMEAAIKAGGSVMHNGEVIDKVEELPDEIELSQHDARQREALASSIDEQIAKLHAQKERLNQPAPASHPMQGHSEPPKATGSAHDDKASDDKASDDKHPPAKSQTQPAPSGKKG